MFADRSLPGGVCLIELTLNDELVVIYVEPEDDTLRVIRKLPQPYSSDAYLLSADFWQPLIGKLLIQIWTMINETGYVDAIQLKFQAPDNVDSVTMVQMYGEASQISIVESTPSRTISLSTFLLERADE